jgi:hypothetical protein
MKPSPSPNLEAHLARFVPPDALAYACSVLRANPCHLHVSRHRKTKRGDFRPGLKRGEKHRLSVNGTLNRYAFLITLLHEIAHAQTWDAHARSVKPHGPEWQAAFRDLLKPVVDADVFPADITKALHRHLGRPAASSCSDVSLLRVLNQYNRSSEGVALETLAEGSRFLYQGRSFEKGACRRTRFLCRELPSERPFTFHPLTEVQPEPTAE